MKRLVIASAFAGMITMLGATTSSHADRPEAKYILTTLPDGGRITFVADTVDKEWTSNIIHLQGNVRAEIMTGPKNGRTFTRLTADRVDYFEKTGEFVPDGNVHMILITGK